MTFAKFFLFTAAAAVSVPAAASVIVIGNGAASNCYQATNSPLRPSLDQLQQCNKALAEEGLGREDLIATHVNRGVLLVRRGQAEAGLRDFDRAIGLDPNQAEAYLNKASVLLRAGQAAAALPLFDTALERKTRKPAYAYYGRGVAHEDMGNVQMAYLDYRRASRADPDWETPRKELSRFMVKGR